MPASDMDGIRNWRFTSGAGAVVLEGTDYWVEYTASRLESGAALGIRLKEIWERADTTVAQGIERRVYIEDRLKALRWDHVGKKGLLELDFGTPQARSFSNITLLNIVGALEAFNDSMEYELDFQYPVGSGGIDVPRTVEFDGKTVNALNFLVVYNKQDRTIFKPLFRAAPVRVPAGPGIETITVTAVKQAIAGASDLLRRQAVETGFKEWTDKKGDNGELKLDFVSVGTEIHLSDVRPSALVLPDALVYELVFLKGYGI